jgi:hypothetical protein
MSVVFPAAAWTTDALAAASPVDLAPFLVSPRFKELLDPYNGRIKLQPVLPEQEYLKARATGLYRFILNQCYGVDEGYESKIVHRAIDQITGLERYYYIKPDFRFMRAQSISGPSGLSEDQKEVILDKLNQPQALKDLLPPGDYEFRGIVLLQAIDVTRSEMLRQLERDLVNSDSVFSNEGFMRLQQVLRTLFEKPELVASISAVKGDYALLLQKGCDLTKNCIFTGARHVPIEQFRGTIFEKATSQEGVLRIPDISQITEPSWVDREIMETGLRCKLIGPLRYQGELIGALDLASPIPGDLGPTHQILLDQLRPLFAVSLKRALDELDTNIQTIIKEKCTAVHPSVEWKFQSAVFSHLERLRSGAQSELEPIVFRNVYPLYAATDIRGSSELRNSAISDDLKEHLHMALEIVDLASRSKEMEILGELSYGIRKQLDSINGALAAGDDKRACNFLAKELEPLFPVFREFGRGVSGAIDRYTQAVDANFSTVYKKRREFDDSVRVFNDRLSQYLDREEAIAQSIFPHYFDKHKTDGIDYLIYMGESMVEDRQFNEVYVKNLRLWQMITACGLAWSAHRLKGELNIPLEATHLILVSHSPISIRFRFDEKRFDVDGAYDTSQEIIRSRIDKAMVSNGTERLTQPGKIATVFSRPEEEEEIRGHLEFLINEGYIESVIEELTLDDLPSVQGLRALRVNVDTRSESLAKRVNRISGID